MNDLPHRKKTLFSTKSRKLNDIGRYLMILLLYLLITFCMSSLGMNL